MVAPLSPMPLSLEKLQGKRIVNIEYQSRCRKVMLVEDGGGEITLRATGLVGVDDIVYFTNFNRFEEVQRSIAQNGPATIIGVVKTSDGTFSQDFNIFTTYGRMSFSLISHRGMEESTVEVYEKTLLTFHNHESH